MIRVRVRVGVRLRVRALECVLTCETSLDVLRLALERLVRLVGVGPPTAAPLLARCRGSDAPLHLVGARGQGWREGRG